jgi:hypothetical protein
MGCKRNCKLSAKQHTISPFNSCPLRELINSAICSDLVNDIKRFLITLPRTNPSIIQGRGPGTMTFWLKLKNKKKKKEEELALSH